MTPPCCPATLAGTNWGVVSVAGRPSVPASTPFIGFTADRVKGTGGCNSFSGGYTYDPTTGSLTFGELMMTLMGCIGPRGDFETVFFTALQGPLQVTQASDGSGGLAIDGPKGRIVLAPAARDLTRRVGWPRQRGGRMVARRRWGDPSVGVRKVRAPQRRVAGNARPP